MARLSYVVDGAAVERLRLAAGYPRQEDLARRAGLHQGTVSKMERSRPEFDNYRAFSARSVALVANALGVASEALMKEEPSPSVNESPTLYDSLQKLPLAPLPEEAREELAEWLEALAAKLRKSP